MADFHLLSPQNRPSDWQALWQKITPSIVCDDWLYQTRQAKQAWQALNKHDDQAMTDWLINAFNRLFSHKNTVLVRGGDEPEYLAATDTAPAQILFAHGYFSSGLHEISHWCIAGKERRAMDDFGYWYCPDGRDEPTQRQFEQVEIKPQAIECLFTLATNRKFFTSADNLTADFDTSFSTFEHDVFGQADKFLTHPHTLPKDAQTLLSFFLSVCQDESILHTP